MEWRCRAILLLRSSEILRETGKLRGCEKIIQPNLGFAQDEMATLGDPLSKVFLFTFFTARKKVKTRAVLAEIINT